MEIVRRCGVVVVVVLREVSRGRVAVDVYCSGKVLDILLAWV
jgi:hypothetical protein